MVVIKKDNPEFDEDLEKQRKARMLANIKQHESYVLSSKLGIKVNPKRGYVDPLSLKLENSNPVSYKQSMDASPRISYNSSLKSLEEAHQEESEGAKRGSSMLPEVNQPEYLKATPTIATKLWPRSNIISQRRNREKFSPQGSAKSYRKKKKSPIDKWIDTIGEHKYQISSDRGSLLPPPQNQSNIRKTNSFANLNFDFIPDTQDDKKGLTNQFLGF